jgi:hypothetical protein
MQEIADGCDVEGLSFTPIEGKDFKYDVSVSIVRKGIPEAEIQDESAREFYGQSELENPLINATFRLEVMRFDGAT